ncbi:MAG: hypothetical protein U0X91_32450 [Spirosomataceae bacterium]
MNGRRAIAYFLLTLISFKLLVVPFVYLDFQLRKEFIIKNLCENRFKPQLHCDGKCYLAKQLHKVAEGHARDEAQKQDDAFKKMTMEVFDEPVLAILTVKVPYAERSENAQHQPDPTADFTSSLLRPPAAVLLYS